MSTMRILAACCYLFSGTLCFAQNAPRFYTTIGAEGDDVGFAVKSLPHGKYILAGASTSYGTNGSVDGYIVKTNSVGFPEWIKFFGGPGPEAFYSIALVPDSGFVAVGYTGSFGNVGYDMFLVRIDKYGDTLWTRTWGGDDWDFAEDIVFTPDSCIIVVGYTESFGNGDVDAVLLKYRLDGTLLWQKFFGGIFYDDFRSVIITNDSMLAIVGLTENGPDSDGDGWFLKMNLDGDTIFTKYIGGPYPDRFNDIVQKPTSEYVIAGAKTFSLNKPSHSYMYCMDARGNFMWENNLYHSISTDEEYVALANSTHLTTHTGFLKNIPVPDLAIQGNIYVASPGGWPYIVNSFGGERDEACYGIDGTDDFGFIIVGKTRSFGSVGDDVFFLKMDSTIFNYTNTVDVDVLPIESIRYFVYDNILYVENVSVPTEVSLIDFSGNLIFCEATMPGTNAINLNTVSAGLYILRFQTLVGEYFHTKILIPK